MIISSNRRPFDAKKVRPKKYCTMSNLQRGDEEDMDAGVGEGVVIES